MTGLIVLGLAVAIFVAVFVLSSRPGAAIAWDRDKVGIPRVMTPVEVRLDDLPAIVEALSRGSSKTRFAALTFGTPDRPSNDDALNLNLTVENGKVGFDWVLLGPRNIEDQEKFKAFARARGSEPVSRSMNGVSYLRVERADLVRFTASIVTEMYHLPATEPLSLFHEGFEWPQR
ncbi:hypothetical protein OF829_08500 [Sphingomonas sp. LB-2]|uniref:hypothetical protein n=1 Tax=Sphingomonas caeni TaxID=2984949 RepID=UPI002230806A|nr:hypothetical protein [Sphingomonas caeni]MCW3847279.1 hypothetical protein [Sphingomonas caeni]